ncbi:hypothetical protein LJC58_02950 [Lachnospiraceae bacterium OttesenSCG-928-D06]|nr:hypothetical protein [Lachnospiraceae bacterium OttesenSCG-928-D06]
MSEKRNALITVCFFCTIMLLFTIADFFTKDRIFSENENRVLASKPKATKETLLSGKYMEEYEDYVTDQFISRDTFIMIKTWGDIYLQKRAINGVYLSKDDYLIEQHLEEDIDKQKVADKIALLQALLEDYDGKVMLVPTADNILSDKLPVNAIYYDQKELLQQVEEAVSTERVIDVYGVLEEHTEEYIYYRTDHHWTSLGAYYAYRQWAVSLKRIPYRLDLDNTVVVTEDFLGTLHSKVNIDVEADSIFMFPETTRRPVSIVYDFQAKSQSFYEEKYLETKNKYGYFLDDTHAFMEIETQYPNGRVLFLIKDSYANSFIPLLMPHYEKIYVVDLRYYHNSLYDLIEQSTQNEKFDLLVLYNCIHFIEEFQYY